MSAPKEKAKGQAGQVPQSLGPRRRISGVPGRASQWPSLCLQLSSPRPPGSQLLPFRLAGAACCTLPVQFPSGPSASDPGVESPGNAGSYLDPGATDFEDSTPPRYANQAVRAKEMSLLSLPSHPDLAPRCGLEWCLGPTRRLMGVWGVGGGRLAPVAPLSSKLILAFFLLKGHSLSSRTF